MSGALAAADSIGAAEDSGPLLARLKSSADRLAVLAEETRAEQTRRNTLILEARDEGTSWRTIARAARCSIARCAAIVSGD